MTSQISTQNEEMTNRQQQEEVQILGNDFVIKKYY
jgi:hypothetical protein